MQQLQFIEEPLEIVVDRRLNEMKNQNASVRKGLFARHSELEKKYISLENEFENLKRAICRASPQH